MKIDDQMRFPHPVLWARTNDYVNGEFAVDIIVEESIASGQLTLQYSVILEQADVHALLDQRKAAFGLFITCYETYYNRLIPLSHAGGVVTVAAGYLRGRVIIRPIVWTIDGVNEFRSESLHPEFGADGISFPTSSILALGEEIVVNVGREKLLRMESIFALSMDDGVPEDQFLVQLEEEAIRIVAAKDTFNRIHALRGTVNGRALLLNSVYLPAIMEVLSSIREDGDRYEGKRWHRVFLAKLDHLNIKAGSGGYLGNAQKLLSSPLGRITNTIDLGAL